MTNGNTPSPLSPTSVGSQVRNFIQSVASQTQNNTNDMVNYRAITIISCSWNYCFFILKNRHKISIRTIFLTTFSFCPIFFPLSQSSGYSSGQQNINPPCYMMPTQVKLLTSSRSCKKCWYLQFSSCCLFVAGLSGLPPARSLLQLFDELSRLVGAGWHARASGQSCRWESNPLWTL